MKLVICNKCLTAISPKHMIPQWCECKEVEVMYKEDGVKILLGGDATVIAISNTDLKKAVILHGQPISIDAVSLPKDHEQIIAMEKAKHLSERVISKVVIQCPECNYVQEADVTQHENMPFATYIHKCIRCQYLITESEWNQLSPSIVEIQECNHEWIKTNTSGLPYQCLKCGEARFRV